jgi:hypothetical protein
MKYKHHGSTLIQIVGAIGYIACALEWLWVAVLYMPALLSSGIFVPMEREVVPVVAQPYHTPSVIDIAIVAGITIIFVALSIYLLLKLPGVVTKTASRAVHVSSDFIMPKVVDTKHTTKKRLLVLSARMQLILKFIAALLPPIVITFSSFPDVPLEPAVIWTVMLFVSAWAVGMFGLQWLLARVFGLDYAKVW